MRMSLERLLGLTIIVTCLYACSSPNQNVFQMDSHDAPLHMQMQVGSQWMNEEELSIFLIQASKSKNSAKDIAKPESKFNDIWAKNWNNANAKRVPDLSISDVILTETNQSIMGAQAQSTIQPNYSGKEIYLTLRGAFKDKKKPLQKRSFLFTLAPDLLLQTFVGKSPMSRVILDHSILLEVISVSESEIKVKMNTQYIPDLYLKGLHHLAVEHDKYFTDALIKIGDPESVNTLAPRISSAEIVYQDNVPARVLLKGQNLMVYPKFSHTTIDGNFGFGFQTEILTDGTSESTVHIPNSSTFDRNTEHSLVYSTPFGVAVAQFGGAQ